MKKQIYLYDMQKNSEQFIDEVLKADPGFDLPDDFADNLAVKFEKHFMWSQYFREFLVYLSVGFGILVVTIAMLFFMMVETWAKFLDIVLNNLTGSIGIVFLLTFILFADRVLLKYFSYKVRAKAV